MDEIDGGKVDIRSFESGAGEALKVGSEEADSGRRGGERLGDDFIGGADMG